MREGLEPSALVLTILEPGPAQASPHLNPTAALQAVLFGWVQRRLVPPTSQARRGPREERKALRASSRPQIAWNSTKAVFRKPRGLLPALLRGFPGNLPREASSPYPAALQPRPVCLHPLHVPSAASLPRGPQLTISFSY